MFPTRADFEAEEWPGVCGGRTACAGWSSADELRQREPSLSRRYTFALLVEENGQCRDPGAYVAALVRHAVALGAELRRSSALGFRIEAGRLVAVRTEGGDIAADKAVIAAGAWSRRLAAEAGDRVPLETERGYHAVITDPASRRVIL